MHENSRQMSKEKLLSDHENDKLEWFGQYSNLHKQGKVLSNS